MTSYPDCPLFKDIYIQLGGTNDSLTDTNCCSIFPLNVVCKTKLNPSANVELTNGINPTVNLQVVNIFEINFNGTDITKRGGSLSPLLGQLKSLQALHIADLGLVGTIPTLPQPLAYLLLQGNRLSGEIPLLNLNGSIAGQSTPFFSIRQNSYGGVYIPSNLANINFGNGCPFDSDMCFNNTVTSCSDVKFTCQSQNSTAPSNSPTSAPADYSNFYLFLIGGGIFLLIILILLLVRRAISVTPQKPLARGTNSEVTLQNSNSNNNLPDPVYQPAFAVLESTETKMQTDIGPYYKFTSNLNGNPYRNTFGGPQGYTDKDYELLFKDTLPNTFNRTATHKSVTNSEYQIGRQYSQIYNQLQKLPVDEFEWEGQDIYLFTDKYGAEFVSKLLETFKTEQMPNIIVNIEQGSAIPNPNPERVTINYIQLFKELESQNYAKDGLFRSLTGKEKILLYGSYTMVETVNSYLRGIADDMWLYLDITLITNTFDLANAIHNK
ncbi:hypothetical protein HDV06_004823 [Boothiomyces sp. JEL0866]|nr:hypothetical protein HDV06_004823 [Boothiomyces sp. JEL0866]